MNAERNELTISRLIEAAPAKVWKAWSTPEHLAKWWIPGPVECKVVKLDLRPGGGFETLMREPPGAFQPHVEACFLDIVPERRLVWTTNLAEDWRPTDPPLALTAIITFEEQDQKTLYSARVLHRNAAERLRHEEMGFQERLGVDDRSARNLREAPGGIARGFTRPETYRGSQRRRRRSLPPIASSSSRRPGRVRPRCLRLA